MSEVPSPSVNPGPTKAERYALRRAADRYIGFGFTGSVLAFAFVATGGGWQTVEAWRLFLYLAVLVGGIVAFVYGALLLCDSKGISRIWALLAAGWLIGVLLLYCVPARKK